MNLDSSDFDKMENQQRFVCTTVIDEKIKLKNRGIRIFGVYVSAEEATKQYDTIKQLVHKSDSSHIICVTELNRNEK